MANPNGNPDNLLPGGVKGHRGGTGRPPSVVRESCRLAFEKRIPLLEKIADDESDKGPGFGERIRAIETLAKHGMPQKVEVSLTNDAVIQAVTDLLPSYIDNQDDCQRFIDDLTDALKGYAG